MEKKRVKKIDKAQVEMLRQETGFGLMDCKKALNRFSSDYEKAKDWLNSDFLKSKWIMFN